MRIDIIEFTQGVSKRIAPLYHSPRNQLRRAVGPFTVVYCGGADGGTVQDQQGKCWDWWPTDETIPGSVFRKLRVVPAR